MSNNRNAFAALAVSALSIAAIIYACTVGPSSRSRPQEMVFGEASTAKDLYGFWSISGARGLRLVNMSSFLHYMEPPVLIGMPEVMPGGNAPYIDMDALIETLPDHTNYLWAAQESGIARRLDHIIPLSGFEAKLEVARSLAGVRVNPQYIMTSDYGTPRVISPLPKVDDEHVLLNIDASYLENASEGELLAVLRDSGLRPLIITFYFAEDSPEVTDRGREALRATMPLIQKIFHDRERVGS
jgi:hypothetical protein